jgi:hypothetical protein
LGARYILANEPDLGGNHGYRRGVLKAVIIGAIAGWLAGLLVEGAGFGLL